MSDQRTDGSCLKAVRVKAAFRALIDVIGSQESAAVAAGVSRSYISRCCSLDYPDVPSCVVAAKLQAFANRNFVSDAMQTNSSTQPILDTQDGLRRALALFGKMAEEADRNHADAATHARRIAAHMTRLAAGFEVRGESDDEN